jgi:allophanate hydrolase subunit 1
VYPSVTPGGWNIVGHTTARPFDPNRSEPFLFTSGDRVRFRPVDPRECEPA